MALSVEPLTRTSRPCERIFVIAAPASVGTSSNSSTGTRFGVRQRLDLFRAEEHTRMADVVRHGGVPLVVVCASVPQRQPHLETSRPRVARRRPRFREDRHLRGGRTHDEREAVEVRSVIERRQLELRCSGGVTFVPNEGAGSRPTYLGLARKVTNAVRMGSAGVWTLRCS